jgi:hypothetical protein
MAEQEFLTESLRFTEADVTRWDEDDDPESYMGDDTADDNEGDEGDDASV